MYFTPAPVPVVPRRVALPVDESPPTVCLNPQFNPPTIDALATFVKKARDTLDYGIDFTDWLKANGDTEIKAVQWDPVVQSGFQTSPILEDQFFPGSEAWVILGPGAAGDNYLIDCTATIAATQARVGGDAIQTLERTIVRRIAVRVYAG